MQRGSTRQFRAGIILRIWSLFAKVISFEWVLTATGWPNGGNIILLRTTGITITFYILAIALKQSLDPDRTLAFDYRELLIALRDTLPWAGAIFAGVYVSLYARFSSQWVYLNGLYNQIKAMETRTAAGANEATRKVIAEWKAGFLEDAQELHLATKPLLASVVKRWGEEPQVKDHFIRYTPGEEARYRALMEAARISCEFHADRMKKQYQQRDGGAKEPTDRLRAVEIRLDPNRNQQLLTSCQALSNLSGMADKVSITVWAHSESGFDRSKLQNDVLELLQEPHLIEK